MIDKNSFKYRKNVFVSSEKGEKLRLRNSNLLVEDKEGKIIFQISCYNILIIYVIGEISVTTALIRNAKKYGFTICIMNSMFRAEALLGNRREGQTALRRKQYLYEGDELANLIIRNKIRNQLAVVRKVRFKSEYMKQSTKKMDYYYRQLQTHFYEKDSLRGIEGNAAKLYFSILFATEHWKSRMPRQRRDHINACMDIGYTILFNYIETICNFYGFDVYMGFFHTEFWIRKSLVCDLVEPFRPIIDSCIMKSLHTGNFKKEDFIVKNGKLELKQKEWKKYQKVFAEALVAYGEHIFSYIRQFYKAFSMEKAIEEFPTFCIEMVLKDI